MVVRRFAPKGGAEKFSLALAEHLRDRGHRVRVLAIHAEPLDGVKVIPVSAPRMRSRVSWDWLTAHALSGALRHERADITWGEQKTWGVMMLRPGGGVEREYWKARGRFQPPGLHAPATLRKLGLKRFFDLRSEQNGYRHPALRRVIVNSFMVKQQCLSHFPELAGRIEVVHNGGDPPRLGPVEDASSRETLLRGVNLQASRTTALFLGHDYVRKGLTEAIRGLAAALRVAPELPLQLLVGGRGRHQPYQRLAARLGVATRVGFAGTRYPTEELLQASDLLVLPTFFDAFANVTVEALSAGRPVLTSTANGAHEILTHGKDSWLIPDPRDSLQMAEHFLELRDPSVLAARQREALRTAGRHRLQQQLSRIEQHMLDVAGRKNRSRTGAPS